METNKHAFIAFVHKIVKRLRTYIALINTQISKKKKKKSNNAYMHTCKIN